MKAVPGIICITISILGILFFRNYQGSVIPFPFVWVIILAGIGAFGFWLLYLSQKEKIRKTLLAYERQRKQFKEQARRIDMNFDNCEFKNGSFSYESDRYNTTTEAPEDHDDTEITPGSYLIYSDEVNGKKERFVSQSFPFDQSVLKLYVTNKKLELYVNRSGEYFFELNG